MKAIKFWRLCLQTYYDNDEKCDGCILAEKGVCERMTVKQIARTRYAKVLKRYVKKREHARANAFKSEESLLKLFQEIEKERSQKKLNKKITAVKGG